MISEQQQEQASLYVLGALTTEEQRAFEAELRSHAELREFTRSLQHTTGLFARTAPPAPLPPGLKAKVLDRIQKNPTAKAPPKTQSTAAALSGLRFLDAGEQQDWKPLPVPGAFIKLLSLEKERGYAVLLGKLEPGVRYPAHTNAGPEDFYILTGDLVIGDRPLVAGDFHHANQGSEHAENYSVGGCTLLAVLTTDDPLVALAMA